MTAKYELAVFLKHDVCGRNRTLLFYYVRVRGKTTIFRQWDFGGEKKQYSMRGVKNDKNDVFSGVDILGGRRKEKKNRNKVWTISCHWLRYGGAHCEWPRPLRYRFGNVSPRLFYSPSSFFFFFFFRVACVFLSPRVKRPRDAASVYSRNTHTIYSVAIRVRA